MANTIKIKRSAVSGKAPTTTDLELGELAVNTFDGKLYTKKDNGTASVVQIGAIPDGDKGDITVSSSGATWTIDSGVVTSDKIADGTIVNGDINASAAIADTKLATISTAGKVSNSATTATSANTASAIVARDASGNFSAGTITATLSGNATTATSATSATSATTATTATNATNVALTTSATASAFKVPFADTTVSTTGNYGLLQDSEATFTYNPSSNTLTAGTFSGALSGNATTATTLQTARTINGTSFNGSANITITANTTNTLTLGSYLTGTSFNGSSAVTAAVDATSANTASKVVARDGSGNFSAGTITATLNGNASTATSATSASSATTAGSCSGNAATATTLQTARTIQGVSFNGSANITVVTAGTGISVSGTAVTNTGVTSVNGSTGAISNIAVTNSAQTFTAAQRGTVSALTDGATITPDFATANNFSVTLGGNRTLANPSNITAGQSGVIIVTQDGTGSRTLSFGSYWKFPAGTAPTLTTTASKVDAIVYYCESTTRISAQAILNMGG